MPSNAVSLRLPNRIFTSDQPAIMAILNITPDSFSDGGRFAKGRDNSFTPDLDAIVDAAKLAIKNGASILDVGGESTKPGIDPIDEAEELRRVVPVVRALKKAVDVPISVDTYRPATADAVIAEGAEIINDISGGRYLDSSQRFADEMEFGFPEEMAEVVARSGAAVVLIHMRGTPKTMQTTPPEYPSGVVEEVAAFLKRRRDAFVDAGVEAERIVLDPGLGFGKTFEQNWSLVSGIEQLRTLGAPLLYGFSRKRFLRETFARYYKDSGAPLPDGTPDQRTLDFETATLCAILAAQKVEILRVHNVQATALALRIARYSTSQVEEA